MRGEPRGRIPTWMSAFTIRRSLHPTSKSFAPSSNGCQSRTVPQPLRAFMSGVRGSNGGAWIQTAAGKVDLLYRNIEQVQRVVDECQGGIYHHHFYQQPTFGFVSVIYLAETKSCLTLFDRRLVVSELKRRVDIYPARLQERLIQDSLWMAEFAFVHAHGFAQRGDISTRSDALDELRSC